jgi:hypothetical protein
MDETQWYTTIDIGTPGQTLRLNIDTGSSGVVVFDPSCTTCSLNNHTAFDGSKSRTFQRIDNSSFMTMYGDGSSSEGYQARDTVTVGSIAVKRQDLLMSTSASGSLWASSGYDGYVGITLDAGAFVNGSIGVFSNMVKRNLLRKPIAGIALVRERNGVTLPPGGAGEYAFGQINYHYVLGAITYAPVTSAVYWYTFFRPSVLIPC